MFLSKHFWWQQTHDARAIANASLTSKRITIALSSIWDWRSKMKKNRETNSVHEYEKRHKKKKKSSLQDDVTSQIVQKTTHWLTFEMKKKRTEHNCPSIKTPRITKSRFHRFFLQEWNKTKNLQTRANFNCAPKKKLYFLLKQIRTWNKRDKIKLLKKKEIYNE